MSKDICFDVDVAVTGGPTSSIDKGLEKEEGQSRQPGAIVRSSSLFLRAEETGQVVSRI